MTYRDFPASHSQMLEVEMLEKQGNKTSSPPKPNASPPTSKFEFHQFSRTFSQIYQQIETFSLFFLAVWKKNITFAAKFCFSPGRFGGSIALPNNKRKWKY